MRILSHEFNSRCVHLHESNSRCVHSHPCVHMRPFVFRASVVQCSDLCVSCVAVHTRAPRKSPFNTIPNQSQFQCFSCPCVSFRMSSILTHARCCLPSNGSAGLRSRPCTARGTPRMCSGTPRTSCSSMSADQRIGHSSPHLWISLWQMLHTPPGSDTVPSTCLCRSSNLRPCPLHTTGCLTYGLHAPLGRPIVCAMIWRNCWLPLQYCHDVIQLNHTSNSFPLFSHTMRISPRIRSSRGSSRNFLSSTPHLCASHASVRVCCVCTMSWNSGPAPSPATLIGHLSGLADGTVLLCGMAPAQATEHSQHSLKCAVVCLPFTRNSVRRWL